MSRRVPTGLILRALFASTFLIGPGCAGVTSSIKPPHVNIADLRIKDVKPLETAFQVELRIVNPNDLALTIKGIECDLELNDQKFGSGVSGETITIPAFGTDLVSVFAGTTLNQTGQAVEVIAMTMAVYLAISLAISLFMNLYNRRMALVER